MKLSTFAGLLSFALISGCVGIPNSNFSAWCQPGQPCDLTYSNGSMYSYPIGTQIYIPGPNYGGGTPNGYVISPTLPPGLGFDPTTGAISGTATSLWPSTMYTVSASNSAGTSSTTISLTITPLPASLAYSVITVQYATLTSGFSETLALTAKDTSGNPLTSGGLNVSFSASGGTSTGSISGVTDNGNGTYTAVFTGATAGTATTIQAFINGSQVTSTSPTITVTAAQQWTWVSGSSGSGTVGTYPASPSTTPSPTNAPGERQLAASWTDSSGNLWLFGGYGEGSSSPAGELADLWEFSASSQTWAWIGGTSSTDVSGSYGTQGIASSTNRPGARDSAFTWTDSSGNFWLFGGHGYDGSANVGWLNDLWMFSPSSQQWTFVSGTQTVNGAGYYGTKGGASNTYLPPARGGGQAWVDSAGYLWLFGGTGYDTGGTNQEGYYSDLWNFNPTNQQWTWVSGVQGFNTNGSYGSLGTASASNSPGARTGGASWMDGSGNLWLFGGYGSDSAGTLGVLGDLWKFDHASTQWIWASGSDVVNATTTWGVKGVANTGNTPGSRQNSVYWSDSSGNFWLAFGENASDLFQDIWEFNPSTSMWTWASGTNTLNSPGTCGLQGSSSSTNLPGGRLGATSWHDPTGALWIFGGDGYSCSGGTAGILSDLWKFY